MRHWLVSTACLLALAVPAAAADKEQPKLNRLTPKEIAEGWILLFDGETTFGWKAVNDAKWTIAEGLLAPPAGSKDPLVTTTTWRDYELRFDFRTREAGKNAGKVTLGCDDKGQTSEKRSIFELTSRGTGWTEVSLKVMGSEIVEQHVKTSNSGEGGGGGGEGFRRGHIALTGEGVIFRNITLKPLGLKPIFNGKDLTGWKEVPGHKSKFAVNDKGELTIKDGNGDIQTDGQWDDFVLQIECFSNGPHLNSGVFFRCIPGEFWSGYEAQVRNEWVSEVVLKDKTHLFGSLTPKGDEISLQIWKEEGGKYKKTNDTKTLKKGDVEQVIEHRDKPIDYGTGGIYNRQEARKVVSSDYEWYTMTINGVGNHLAIWVNGYQTADFDDTRPADKSARKGSKTDKGTFSLQGHDPTTDLSFRNIRAAEMPEKTGEVKPPEKK